MVIGLCVTTRKRVDVRAAMGIQKIAETLHIGVVQRCIDLIEDADRRRVGEEDGKDQRQRGQRLLTARQQCDRLRLLARRLGDDVEAGIERIIGIDQGQFGLAATKKLGKQFLELFVHPIKGFQELHPAFAVERRDGTAQLGDRFGDIVALQGQRVAALGNLLGLLFGRQIDRAQALTRLAQFGELAFQNIERRGCVPVSKPAIAINWCGAASTASRIVASNAVRRSSAAAWRSSARPWASRAAK